MYYREILLSSIGRKLKLEGQGNQYEAELARIASDSEQFQQVSDRKEQCENELKGVEERIAEAARRVLDFPLDLIDPASDRNFLKNLEEARGQYCAGNWDQAYQWAEQAEQALGTDSKHQRSDEGLIWLFRAGIAAAAGARLADPQRARDGLAWLARASARFSADDFLYRMVAQVIAGNARRAAGGRASAVLSDYEGALDPLKELFEDANKRGNIVEISLYNALGGALNHRITEIQALLKATPVPQPPPVEADVSAQTSAQDSSQPAQPDQSSTLRLAIPMYGTIRAGKAAASEKQDGTIVVQQSDGGTVTQCQIGERPLRFVYLSGKTAFNFNLVDEYVALHVEGDSMNQAGIDPDDYVVLQKAGFGIAESEDIVAAAFFDYDDRAMLKQIHIDADQHGRRTAVVFKPRSFNPIYRERAFSLTDPDPDGPLFRVVCIARAVLKPIA